MWPQDMASPLSAGYAPRSFTHPPPAVGRTTSPVGVPVAQPVPAFPAVGDLFEPVTAAGPGRTPSLVLQQGLWPARQYPLLPSWNHTRTHLTGEDVMQVSGSGRVWLLSGHVPYRRPESSQSRRHLLSRCIISQPIPAKHNSRFGRFMSTRYHAACCAHAVGGVQAHGGRERTASGQLPGGDAGD